MKSVLPEARTAKGRAEPTRRLSVNLPESLHTRFKTACSATSRKMVGEIQDFVARRTGELEREAGLSMKGSTGASNPRLSAAVRRRSRALDRASRCNHPTGTIDKMLADIERSRDLR